MLETTPRQITIQTQVSLPDPVKLERFKRTPDVGPRVLFFSGGSALKDLSRVLVTYTHNSIHLITPFDSGGSSAVLRKAFGMLSVGDMRNRLMALADQSVSGNPAIVRLFAYRLSKDANPGELRDELRSMHEGGHPWVAAVHDPMRKLIRNHIGYFINAMPDAFDLKGASIGNLILVGGYLNNGRHIDPVIYLFSKLAEVKGAVRPVVSADLHLAVELEDPKNAGLSDDQLFGNGAPRGPVIVGQHQITGKETTPLTSPIRRLYLSRELEEYKPAWVALRDKVRELIRQAELIVFPMGSFYSSVLATLMPDGVGEEVEANPAPKIYIPNTGIDPEQLGLTVDREVELLNRTLRLGGAKRDNVVDFVLVDSEHGYYHRELSKERISELGPRVIDMPLAMQPGSEKLDAAPLASALLSLL